MNEEANKETPNTNAQTAEQPQKPETPKTGKSKVWKIVGICLGVIAAIGAGVGVACACSKKGETAPAVDPEPAA